MRYPASLRVDDEIELRLLEKRHAPDVFALTDENREHLRPWLPWVDGTRSVQDTIAFIERSIEQARKNNGFQAGIWYRGQLAGVIGNHFIDWPNKKTVLGYWLGAPFQGRGIMTRACHALVTYAFKNLELNRVEIQAATENVRSQRVPERLGFAREGVLREAEWVGNRFVDHVVYGLIRKDWDNTQA